MLELLVGMKTSRTGSTILVIKTLVIIILAIIIKVAGRAKWWVTTGYVNYLYMTLVIIMFWIAKTSVTIIIVIAALNNLKNKEIISKYIDWH